MGRTLGMRHRHPEPPTDHAPPPGDNGPVTKRLLLAALLSLPLLLAACEGKDKSYSTSPSLRALIGTTTGNVAFRPDEVAPEPVDAPDRWQVEFNLATFSELENGQPSLQIVAQVETRPGTGFELWLSDETGATVARWSGGSTTTYVGTMCFQLELEREGEAVPLGDGDHTATMVFREPVDGVIAARVVPVTSQPPRLDGVVPAPGSPVYRDGLACPKGS